MKVLYVITKSNYGGAQKYVFELARTMQKNGHDVTVAAGGTGERQAETGKLHILLDEHAIRFIHIQNFLRNMSFIRDMRAFFELRTLIAHEKPDVLHVTSSKAGGLGALAGRICGVQKIIFTSHGLTFDESWRPKLQRILITIFTWFTVLCSHKTIMISETTMKKARALPFCRNKVTLIHNGIAPPDILSKTTSRNALGINTVPDDTIVLGTIAELHPNKNIAIVLDALHQIAVSKPPVHFVVIGSGELEKALKAKASKLGLTDQVHFVGYIQNASQYLLAFDIFILPSFKEGLPYVLLEAGCAGIPVIASNISGNTDIISDEENGLLFDPKKIETLTPVIKRLVSKPKDRTRFGDALKDTIQNEYQLEKMIDETAKLYEI